MDTKSDAAVHNGATAQKVHHYYTQNPLTNDPAAKHSLRGYHVTAFEQAPHSTPIPSKHNPSYIEAAHQSRVTGEMKAIMARLNKQ